MGIYAWGERISRTGYGQIAVFSEPRIPWIYPWGVSNYICIGMPVLLRLLLGCWFYYAPHHFFKFWSWQQDKMPAALAF